MGLREAGEVDTRREETSQRTDNITEEEVEGSPRMRSLSLRSLTMIFLCKYLDNNNDLYQIVVVEFYCLEIFLVFVDVLPMGLFDFWGKY